MKNVDRIKSVRTLKNRTVVVTLENGKSIRFTLPRFKEWCLKEYNAPMDSLEKLGFKKTENEHGICYVDERGFDACIFNKMNSRLYFYRSLNLEQFNALHETLKEIEE